MTEIVVEELDVQTLDPNEVDAQRLTQSVHEMSDWYKGRNEPGLKYFQEHSVAGGRVFVIREQEDIVAVACYEIKHERGEHDPVVMHPVSYPVAFVHGMTTSRTSQGKGYGTAVLKTVLQNIKDNGIRYVQLTCNPDREGAIRLYKKFGFKEIGQKQKSTDVTKKTTLFELDLAQ